MTIIMNPGNGEPGGKTGLVERLADSSAFSRLLALLERASGNPAAFTVLTYHRVDDPANRPMLAPNLAIQPQAFESQIHWLAENCHVVSLERVAKAMEDRQPLPPRAVAITFDDGYRDFAEQAWPILRQRQLPVTLFVPTAYPGRPERVFWWDRLYHALTATSASSLESPLGKLTLVSPRARRMSYKRARDLVKKMPDRKAGSLVNRICETLDVPPFENPVLDWRSLHELSEAGVSIAPHGRTHARLNQISTQEAQAEIDGSREDIAQHLGHCPAVFAYPEGAYSDEVVKLVASSGFRLGLTTNPGTNRLANCDPLRLRRFHIGTRTTLPILRARLLTGR